MKKLCIVCKAEMDFDAKFCNECGKLQQENISTQPTPETAQKQCPKCLNQVIASAPFCSKCGNQFSTKAKGQVATKPNQVYENQRVDFNPEPNLPAPYQTPPNQMMQQPAAQNFAQNQLNSFPIQLQTVATLQLIVGILQVLGGIASGIYVLVIGILTFGTGLLLAFIPLIFLVVGTFSIISGAKGLSKNPSYGLSMFVAISQMCMILICDVISFIFGLMGIIFLNNSEVKTYFRNK